MAATSSYVAGARTVFHLWLRPVGSAEARQLQGTEGGRFPFWSPDSQFIAFFAGNKLKKVSIGGGPVMELADAVIGRGGSWSRDNVILFGSAGSGLNRVSSGGGVATAVTTLAQGEDAHRWPHFLPDGQHFLLQRRHLDVLPCRNPGRDKNWLARSSRAQRDPSRGRFNCNLRVRPPAVRARRSDDGSGIRS